MYTDFPEKEGPPQNSKHLKAKMKPVPHSGYTNNGRHRKIFSCHGDLAPAIFAHLCEMINLLNYNA